MNKKSPQGRHFTAFPVGYHSIFLIEKNKLYFFAFLCYNHNLLIFNFITKEEQVLDFKKISLEDLDKIKPFLKAQYRSCDYSVLGVFMWAEYFSYEYCVEDGILFMREKSKHPDVEYDYLLPLSFEHSLSDCVSRLISHADGRLTMSLIPEDALAELRQNFDFTAEEVRSIADYLYNAEDLALLAGKKYSKKRNLIHQFENLYPDYRLEPITPENAAAIAECCHKDWSDSHLSELAQYENEHTQKVLEDFAAYGCTGYALYVGDEIAAFCIGEVLGDTLIVHIEKARREFKGAFQMINMLFAETELRQSGIKYINREDDVGDDGLRQAKMSYFPEFMLNKFRLTL